MRATKTKVQSKEDVLVWFKRAMFFTLLAMVACFFSWTDNMLITRVVKVVGRMSCLGMAAFLLWKLKSLGLKWKVLIRYSAPLYLYIAYLILGFASLMWSTNVGYSALQWFMIAQITFFSFCFILVTKILINKYDLEVFYYLKILSRVAFLFCLLFSIGCHFAPDYFFRAVRGGADLRLGGWIMNPNELGMLAVVSLAPLLFEFKERKKRFLFVLEVGLLVYTIHLTGSRSSLIAFVLVIAFQVFLNIPFRTFLFMGLFGVFMGVVFIALKSNEEFKDDKTEDVLSMTGRLPFWRALIGEALPREPLLGYGFMRINYEDTFQGRDTYPGKMTHNAFVQALLNLGIIGFLIAFFQFVMTLKGLIDFKEIRIANYLRALLIPVFINSLTEFGIFGESNYGILFYQLIFFFIVLEVDLVEKRTRLKKRRDRTREIKTR